MRNFTVIAAQNFGVRYARLIPCVKTLTQKASGKAKYMLTSIKNSADGGFRQEIKGIRKKKISEGSYR